MKYWKSSGNCAAFVLLVPVRFSSTSLHYSNVVWQLLSPYLWVIRLAFFISVHVEYWCFLTGTQCFTTQVPITLPQCTVLMKLFTRCKYLYRLKIIKKMIVKVLLISTGWVLKMVSRHWGRYTEIIFFSWGIHSLIEGNRNTFWYNTSESIFVLVLKCV